ncbi:hypothetical protein [Streptomyces alanosinicus]|uniref:Uncharacterized protein n=1 Tax=Streptomyces alanosinicus TaxID=68171 RepID=A0A919D4Q5_9ACTN|nr:hypothetical protein [Streptomyces alanosinicus]GHE05253.1 hypothetical protein GCM10010339_40330 [Streptomyces alanosinicus]
MTEQKVTVMNMGRRSRTARAGMSGRQLLMAQAVVIGSLCAALLVKELPGIMREVRIYRMTGGLGANRRYP